MITQTEPKTTLQEVQIMGEHLLTTVKGLIHEGNVRRIIIKQDEHTIAEFPLTVGVVGVMLDIMWPSTTEYLRCQRTLPVHLGLMRSQKERDKTSKAACGCVLW